MRGMLEWERVIGRLGRYEHAPGQAFDARGDLSDLAAAGQPVTLQSALMVMINEMNFFLGTDVPAADA